MTRSVKPSSGSAGGPRQKIAGLHLETAGSGEAVVFLHGFGLDMRMWDEAFALTARTRLTVRYDLRGYGRSPLPDGPYSHVEDLAAILGALCIPRAHIVGFSMGGRVALRTALERSDLVRSLVLVDAAADGHAWSAEWSRRWADLIAAARAGDMDGARLLWLMHPIFAPACERTELEERLAGMLAGYSGFHWANDDPAVPPRFAAPDAVAQIAAPTTVVVGERDLPDFHAIADALSVRIPGARKTVIPGAGHMSPIEAPDVFAALLSEHLARADGGTG